MNPVEKILGKRIDSSLDSKKGGDYWTTHKCEGCGRHVTELEHRTQRLIPKEGAVLFELECPHCGHYHEKFVGGK